MKHDNRIADKLNNAAKWIAIPLMAVLAIYILFMLTLPLCLDIERKTTSTSSRSMEEAKEKGTYINSYSETARDLYIPDASFIPVFPAIEHLFLERRHWYTCQYSWFGHYAISDSIYSFKFVFHNDNNPWRRYKFWFDEFDYQQINSDTLPPSELPATLLLHVVSTDSSRMCHGTITLKRND